MHSLYLCRTRAFFHGDCCCLALTTTAYDLRPFQSISHLYRAMLAARRRLRLFAATRRLIVEASIGTATRTLGPHVSEFSKGGRRARRAAALPGAGPPRHVWRASPPRAQVYKPRAPLSAALAVSLP
ncbi:hypothetical protein RR48_02866 [Papilio machaon]|uniref:Uncharacterized protein n=1 Tax=Papilio machaon TaxID=76193 RepID=A0A0N1IQ61_PAPMA|nr:hypothetical protein RR48_02866 [Papilio machaon]